MSSTPTTTVSCPLNPTVRQPASAGVIDRAEFQAAAEWLHPPPPVLLPAVRDPAAAAAAAGEAALAEPHPSADDQPSSSAAALTFVSELRHLNSDLSLIRQDLSVHKYDRATVQRVLEHGESLLAASAPPTTTAASAASAAPTAPVTTQQSDPVHRPHGAPVHRPLGAPVHQLPCPCALEALMPAVRYARPCCDAAFQRFGQFRQVVWW